ncbi:Aquaporin TIP4-1 [Eumeta japonica]|uniref:Aquaporin TIP4-1 n=1 Tax=Eumeta variegata TaxID=151549 RepID=A0A4C1WKV2_EUMVA|nr:Aquaporin TIP4-1 [Eumeta japonica]
MTSRWGAMDSLYNHKCMTLVQPEIFREISRISTVSGLNNLQGAVTGASMNPARSLGPALWTRRWAAHWVYWAGPLGASGATALLYRRVWAAPAGSAPRAAPSPVPARPRSPL